METYVRVCKDKLSQRVIQSEAVDVASLHGQYQLCRGTIHGKTARHQLRAGETDLFRLPLGVLGQTENTKDGSNRYTSVEVAGTVDGIANNGVFSVAGEDNRFLFFLRNQDFYLAGTPHDVDEDLVADHIQLLLVVTSDVGGAGKTYELRDVSWSCGSSEERELTLVRVARRM
jgi:hypothetical protein